MSKPIDYAKTAHMDSWLRHPVLGDPSFDTFERLGDAIHRSAAPYEWAVNASLFRDHDGTWYCYTGLYPEGYYSNVMPRFRIYRSTDQGKTWEDLGWGFAEGFQFDGDLGVSDVCPDAVVFYDEKQKRYLMTYDTGSVVHSEVENHGVALAWADTPAGPFDRHTKRIVTNDAENGSCGKYARHYATTVIPRKKDYLALILTDSQRYYSWALAASTAPTAEGPWSRPHVILCCDRPEYYPCPVEFYPAQVHNGTVYSTATSVAMNRSYQALFEAPLEHAHDPAAWKLTSDGNLWHSENRPDEAYGIWGQTYHGFVDPDTGRFVVVYPTRNTEGMGILSLAARPWDTPHSDGFTMSAHGGPAISPLLCAYGDFSLDAAFSCSGTADFAFAYNGILGPNQNRSDSIPCSQSLADYSAVRIQESQCSLITVSQDNTEQVWASIMLPEKPTHLRLSRTGNLLSVWINDRLLCADTQLSEIPEEPAPLALVLREHTHIRCSRFAVTGTPAAYSLKYNATDALLGAGQLQPEDVIVDPTGTLSADQWHPVPGGYVGQGHVAGKWNVIGSRFVIPLEKSPAYGIIGIWVDGHFNGSVNLCGHGKTAFQTEELAFGRHAIRVAPLKGRIAISQLLVMGCAE